MLKKSKKTVLPKLPPYPFVLDELSRVSPYTKPMFGCTAIYVNEKIVLILRQKKENPKDNGVWIATTAEHHESLKKEFPKMRSISVFGPGVTGWQVLPETAPDFEASVYRVCEMVIAGDPRVGKIPGQKKKSPAGKKPTRRSNQK